MSKASCTVPVVKAIGYGSQITGLDALLHSLVRTGLLLAAGALQADASAPVMHLRSMNPYVTAALQVCTNKLAHYGSRRCLQHLVGPFCGCNMT
jgi:hypothetical protein